MCIHLLDWLMNCLIDRWSIDRLAKWLSMTDWLIEWLIDWLTKLSIRRLIDLMKTALKVYRDDTNKDKEFDNNTICCESQNLFHTHLCRLQSVSLSMSQIANYCGLNNRGIAQFIKSRRCFSYSASTLLFVWWFVFRPVFYAFWGRICKEGKYGLRTIKNQVQWKVLIVSNYGRDQSSVSLHFKS